MTIDRRFGVMPALAWMVLSFLVLPLVVVFPVSLTDTRFLSLPQEGLSLRHWINLFTSEAWLRSIWQSVVIAVSSTAIAVVAGTLCAVGCWRITSKLSEAVRTLMLVPIIIPTIIYALGLYKFYVDLRLLGSYTGVIAAHAVTGVPYVVITVSASLANFDPRLEQAARNLGANLGQTIRMVILPNIMPGILSGAIFAFVHSWDELIVVLFIASRTIFTLPRMMWNGIQENLDPTIAVVAVALILMTLILLSAELALRARRARLGTGTT
ncbi:MAG: ABC transporter permease [Alphaproteobacteria bacterium]|nr:ABC transporter permease [Alphaproteobacteria bacterium]